MKDESSTAMRYLLLISISTSTCNIPMCMCERISKLKLNLCSDRMNVFYRTINRKDSIQMIVFYQKHSFCFIIWGNALENEDFFFIELIEMAS